MELFVILLSSLLAIISPANLILDGAVEKALRSRVAAVEQLEVRIDNAPSYQILAGKVEKLRIASRGIEPVFGLRIEVLELETESLNVDLEQLRGEFPKALQQPLRSGIRIVITEADLNKALQSPKIQSRLQQLLNRSLPQGVIGAGRYKLLNPRLRLENSRVQLQGQLQSSSSDAQTRSLDVSLELGIEVVAGRELRLIDPEGVINGRPLSKRLLRGFAQGLSSRLDLRLLETAGITARLLQLEVEDEQINLAAFVRIEAQ